jgi:hypothetical protein
VDFLLKQVLRLTSEPATARGNPVNPLTDTELLEKYRVLTRSLLGEQRSSYLETAVAGLKHEDSVMEEFFLALFEPV